MVSRRQFLRGNLHGRSLAQRPPWALPEELFVDTCSRCSACLAVCPTRVIVVVRGFPQVDFTRGECTFCGACADACKDHALLRGADASQATPWDIKAHIGDGCLARHGVECRSCGDQCQAGAIRFSPRLGGPSVPQIDASSCTGCGACVAPCPVTAISVT